MNFWQLNRYWENFSQRKYTHLLLSLIIFFLIASILPSNNSTVTFLQFIFVFNLLLVVRTFEVNKRVKRIFQCLAILVILIDLFIPIKGNDLLNLCLEIIYLLITSVFMLLAIVFLIKRLFQDKNVNLATIQGGISIYFLLGFLWFFWYRILYLIDPDSFSLISADVSGQYELLYFSFTTLTTLGYGDISPINKFAMTLTNFEAIVGQMYPVIFIARLVSLYESNN